MADPETTSPGKWQKRWIDYREKLLQAALLGVPLAAIGKLNDVLNSKLFREPWEAAWFLVPVGIGVWVLRQGIATRDRVHSVARLLAFLGAYVLLFSIAAQSSFLDLSRELTAFGKPASRRWLAPVAWGDWRYRFAPRKADAREELVIVLLKPGAGRSLPDSRKELADLVTVAAQNGARGVALDAYFDEPSPIDPLLCRVVARSGIPVIVGYGFDRFHGVIAEHGVPETLQSCFAPERQGHLAGLLDFDHVSRLMPLFFRNDPGRPALGLAVARALAGDEPLRLPSDGLLRFIPPPSDPPTLTIEELLGDAGVRQLVRNRFVMAGENSERDSFSTPFGRKPGIVIHAYVVHSLRQGHYFRKHSWWFGLVLTLVLCSLSTIWCASGVPMRRIVLLCGGESVLILAIAIVGVLTGPYWFDVIYPLLAVWLLVPILIGLRRQLSAAVPHPAVARPVAPV